MAARRREKFARSRNNDKPVRAGQTKATDGINGLARSESTVNSSVAALEPPMAGKFVDLAEAAKMIGVTPDALSRELLKRFWME